MKPQFLKCKCCNKIFPNQREQSTHDQEKKIAKKSLKKRSTSRTLSYIAKVIHNNQKWLSLFQPFIIQNIIQANLIHLLKITL
jgi:hypothetical protein